MDSTAQVHDSGTTNNLPHTPLHPYSFPFSLSLFTPCPLVYRSCEGSNRWHNNIVDLNAHLPFSLSTLPPFSSPSSDAVTITTSSSSHSRNNDIDHAMDNAPKTGRKSFQFRALVKKKQHPAFSFHLNAVKWSEYKSNTTLHKTNFAFSFELLDSDNLLSL